LVEAKGVCGDTRKVQVGNGSWHPAMLLVAPGKVQTQGPPSQCSMRWVSGAKPWPIP
jgi:hypothetical protein